MPDPLRHRTQLVRLIAKYTLRLEDLYGKFVTKLLALGYGAGVLEQDPLFHFDDIPEIKGEMNTIVSDYVTEQLLTYKSGIQSGVALAYEHDAANLTKYSVLSNNAIQEARETAAAAFFRNRMNVPQGLNLSQMVWNYTDQARGEVEVAMGNVIADGIKSGTSAESVGRKVRRYLNNPDMMYRRYHQNVVENGTKRDVVMWRRRVVGEDGKIHFVEEPLEQVGTGTYRSARKNGVRLARTEINAAYHKANYDRWQQEPFVIGIRIFLSPQHPEYDICDELEGNYPKDFLWTGWHPQCMCASAPITIEGDEKREFYRRMLRGEDMSRYESPNAIKDVPEGYKQYVRDNVDKIVDADMRGKLAWHLRDNRKYWENIDLTPSDELPLTLQNFDKRIEDWHKKHSTGLTSEQEQKLVEAMKKVINESDYGINVPFRAIEDILNDGEFKNQLETGTSRGALDPRYRRYVSGKLFGTDLKAAKDSDFEKYGMLFRKDMVEQSRHTSEGYCYLVDKYEGMQVRFKKDKVLATFTLGDSLNYHDCASWISKPDVAGMASVTGQKFAPLLPYIERGEELTLSKIERAIYDYVEIQYHGKLTTDMIESIFLTTEAYNNLPANVLKKITSLGCKVFINVEGKAVAIT